MSNPVTMWACFSRSGRMLLNTVRRTREESIHAMYATLDAEKVRELWLDDKWKYGVYCAKVRVEEIK